MLMRTRPEPPPALPAVVGAAHPQAQACLRCAVRQDALFGALDETGLQQLHAHIPSRTAAPGDTLYHRASQGDALFTVRAGLVRFERITEAGTRRIVRLAGRGELIGHEALLGLPYADDAVACTPVQLCRIPAPLVDTLGRDHGALQRELMRRWQRALDDAQAWTAELTAGPARRRVLQLLLLLQRHADEDGRIWLPRREQIGDMLDMTVETASRHISRLRREGVLQPLPPQHARLQALRLHAACREADAVA
jgi:CRP-like cAMP-binding protein